MNDGALVSDILQAAQRTTLRTVLEDGGTPPTRLFCTLPEGEPGDRMLAAIRKALPGITVLPWTLQGSGSTKYKRTEFEAALIAVFANMKPGVRVKANMIRKDAGIDSDKIWRVKLLPRIVLGDPADSLVQAMKKYGVRYETGGAKGGVSASFIKQ